MNRKEIEIILGVILVIIILKYFFMPNILNWIAGYEIYNSDCSMNIKHMEPMTIGGHVVPDFCNTARFIALAFMVIDILLMIFVYGVNKYLESKKKGKKK